MEPEYEIIIGADNFTTASFLTENSNITIPLKALYGIEISIFKILSTRLDMLSKDVWILIKIKSDGSLPYSSLLKITDRLEVVYIKILDLF
jgi:hypothetical protein